MPEHNGTAVHSLACEHLQEVENLVSSARQKREEIAVAALGSLYKVTYYTPCGLLVDSHNQDCILEILSFPGP